MAIMVKVTVPADADPIQFKALNREFGCHVLQIVRRSDIGTAIEEPISWFDLRLHVKTFSPEALGT